MVRFTLGLIIRAATKKKLGDVGRGHKAGDSSEIDW